MISSAVTGDSRPDFSLEYWLQQDRFQGERERRTDRLTGAQCACAHRGVTSTEERRCRACAAREGRESGTDSVDCLARLTYVVGEITRSKAIESSALTGVNTPSGSRTCLQHVRDGPRGL